MTSKAKAIEALEKAKSYKALTGFPIDDDIIEAFESVINYPTLDDAIEVVERLWTEQPYDKAVNEFYHSILTALKGLKEENKSENSNFKW